METSPFAMALTLMLRRKTSKQIGFEQFVTKKSYFQQHYYKKAELRDLFYVNIEDLTQVRKI